MLDPWDIPLLMVKPPIDRGVTTEEAIVEPWLLRR
jgi:hypothetical protein